MPIARLSFHHICELEKKKSYTYLPPLKLNASCLARFLRFLRKSILISENNPRCIAYYRSVSEIRQLRKEQVQKGIYIIHPLSMFSVFYEIWMGLVFIVCLIFVPANGSFNINGQEHPALRCFNIVLCCISIVDIIVRFFYGYMDKKQRVAVLDFWQIAWHYVTGYFIFDLLSSLTISGDPKYDKYNKIVRILNMLKIVRLKTAHDYFERSAEYFNVKSTVLELIGPLFFILLVFHWTACLFFLVPQLRFYFGEDYHPDAWIFTWDDLLEKSFLDRYICSLYKATGLLLCIRFEIHIIVPWEEITLTIFTYFFGKILLTYITVVTCQLLLTVRALETKYYEIIQQIEYFMIEKRLSKDMRKRILKFYDYKYNKTYFKENKIVNLLSESLRKEINAENLKTLSQTVAIFEEIPQKKLQNILAHLRLEIFMPNDIIIKAGTVADCMYFLSSGTVSVYSPSGKEMCHLHDGSYFGEICMVLKDEKKRTANVIALEICEVYKLTKKGLHSVLKDNGLLARKIEAVALERLEIVQLYEEVYMRQFFEATVNRTYM